MSPSISIECHPSTAGDAFRRHFFAAVRHVLEKLTAEFGSLAKVVDQFPFLDDYASEIESFDWQDGNRDDLFERLHAAFRLTTSDLNLFFATGLIEEDARFGALIEWAQPFAVGQHRPTLGLLTAWWRDEQDCSALRRAIEHLRYLGLIEVVNPEAPRLEWAFQPVAAAWDLIRGGEMGRLGWARFRPPAELTSLDDLLLEPGIARRARELVPLIHSGEVTRILIRGPRHNGRRTLLGALAREANRGVFEVTAILKPDDARWNLAGTLAALLNAMPIVTLDPGPGEVLEPPPIPAYAGAVGLVLGRAGTVSECHDGALIELDIPNASLRAKLWATATGNANGAVKLAERLRLTTGNIVRAAASARVHHDIRTALRSLGAPLEALASRVVCSGGWNDIAVPADILEELRGLEVRCRNRERLGNLRHGAAMHWNCGVRALFNGPSGAGKTMAARLLASTLDLDLYRLDLSAVVNKYIGETEKSLEQLLSRAEELNVVLLIDEGDALLTARTGVQNANDRYANMETNFLLQRLESFEGIVVVTTNAVQRIDPAFQRRMDVVVDFRLPEASERWAIWQLHLPLAHAIDTRFLEEVAVRCPLSGGQIRNAVLHASTLAFETGLPVVSPQLESAVQREYRKMGAVCPLKTGPTRLRA